MRRQGAVAYQGLGVESRRDLEAQRAASGLHARAATFGSWGRERTISKVWFRWATAVPALQEGLEALDEGGGPLREIGERSRFLTLTGLARRTREAGHRGWGVAVGGRLRYTWLNLCASGEYSHRIQQCNSSETWLHSPYPRISIASDRINGRYPRDSARIRLEHLGSSGNCFARRDRLPAGGEPSLERIEVAAAPVGSRRDDASHYPPFGSAMPRMVKVRGGSCSSPSSSHASARSRPMERLHPQHRFVSSGRAIGPMSRS